MQKQFNYHVKQLSQFMNRFNYSEKLSTLNGQEVSKLKNIASLFNVEDTLLVKNATTLDFLELVGSDSNNYQLRFTDTSWFAVSKATFIFQNRLVKINVILRQDGNVDSGFQWKIADVKSDFFHLQGPGDQSKFFINPMNHEIGFTELTKAFNGKVPISTYTFKSERVNFLTTFLFMLQNGDLKFKQIDQIEFIFFQIPHWVFTVSDFSRQQFNSGWLISRLQKISNTDLMDFRNSGFSKL